MGSNDVTKDIFISYSWKDIDLVNTIDKDFQSIGLTLIRDIRDVKYMESFLEFMKRVRTSDYAFIIISDSYLKSRNCMFEIMELIKDDSYSQRIIPVIIQDTNIFDIDGILQYVRYWDIEYKRLNDELSKIDAIKVEKLIKELKIINGISIHISDFLDKIKDMKCISFNRHSKNIYKEILDIIGFEDRDTLNKLINIRGISDLEEQDIQLEEIINCYPKHKQVLLTRAMIQCDRKKYKMSRMYYEKLLEIYPDYSVAHNNYAVLLVQHFCNFKKAKQHYIEAIKHNDFYADACFNLALLLSVQLKEYEMAKVHYLEAIKINPYNPDYYNNLAVLLIEDYFKDYDSARLLYLKAIELNPAYAKTHNNLANLLYGYYKDFEGAKYHYYKSLEIDYQNSSTHENLAKLLSNDYFNQDDEARRHRKESIKFNNMNNLYNKDITHY